MMKIQINSLQALERLIGNDNQLEIDIRNSVVQDFTKKHLKSLVTTNLMLDIAETVKNEIRSEFFEIVTSGYSSKAVFKSDTLDQLKSDLHTAARRELTDIVNDIIAEYSVDTTIKDKLTIAAQEISDQLTSKNLEARLNRMVDQRLKEKLGL